MNYSQIVLNKVKITQTPKKCRCFSEKKFRPIWTSSDQFGQGKTNLGKFRPIYICRESENIRLQIERSLGARAVVQFQVRTPKIS